MIRQATRGDIRELAELWSRAFPGERTVEDRERHLDSGGVYGGLDSAWIAERGGRTVGAFRAYPLTQHMHGTQYRMMGLAAVAVDESARRQGVARELCEHAVRTSRERGDVLSMLYPFRPSFYHALGWGLVGELHVFRFRPESLVVRVGGDVVRTNVAEAASIAACYARFAKETNGLVVRTPRVWRQHLESGTGTHIYVTGDDQVRGYLIVRYGRTDVPDEKSLYIRELVAENHEAYETLVAWLSAQRDSWRVIHYEAAPDERFVHRLSDPRPPGYRLARNLWAPVGRVVRGPMMRVLDVRAALEQRKRWGYGMPVTFGLEVRDDMVPENRGPFVVTFDGVDATVAAGTARPLLRIGAAAFAQVFAGELSVRDALMLGVAESDGDAAAIDVLLRVDRCFRLLDEF